MQELYSYQIEFNKPLKTNQIMKLYKLLNKDDTDMYLHQNHLIADARHLPKLLSFFLLMEINQPLILIIDGQNAGKTYEEVTSYWEGHIESTACRKKYTGAVIKNNPSISV